MLLYLPASKERERDQLEKTETTWIILLLQILLAE